MVRRLIPLLAIALVAMPPAPLVAKKLPENWDGLVKADAKRLGAVYLRPQADFRGYTRVMIDRPEIAFKKDWQRDYNRDTRDLSRQIGDKELRKAIDEASTSFVEALDKAYAKAGYQTTDQPGPDVLRVSTAVINISVDAPDTMSAGRVRTYAAEAGEATFVVEARDSVSGSLMGRAVDRRTIGDNTGGGPYLRNSVTNRADFEQMFGRWARISAEGLTKLKAMSPFGGTAATR